MMNSLMQQLGQSLSQWAKSPSGQNVIRYAIHTAVTREIPRWYNNLSYEEKQRVDATIVWAIKKAIVSVANSYGGPVTGAIVEKAVELAMERLNENDENARKDVQSLIEEKVKDINLSILSPSTTASSLEQFRAYEDYLKWFKKDSPNMNPFSEKEFYCSLRYREEQES
jgi:hypothetical protein